MSILILSILFIGVLLVLAVLLAFTWRPVESSENDHETVDRGDGSHLIDESVIFYDKRSPKGTSFHHGDQTHRF